MSDLLKLAQSIDWPADVSIRRGIYIRGGSEEAWARFTTRASEQERAQARVVLERMGEAEV